MKERWLTLQYYYSIIMVVSTILLGKENMNYLGQKTYIAALYARLSSEDLQEGTSVSIETQKKRLEELEQMKVSKRDIASVKLQIANLEASKAELELEAGE